MRAIAWKRGIMRIIEMIAALLCMIIWATGLIIAPVQSVQDGTILFMFFAVVGFLLSFIWFALAYKNKILGTNLKRYRRNYD